MDLASYALYRRNPGSDVWTKVTMTTARSVTDPLVNPDDRTPYYYEVRAKDKAGNVSTGSKDTIVQPLPVVASLTGAYNWETGKVTLNWPQNTEAHFHHYTVLSNDMVDGYWKWVPLGTTTSNTWTTAPIVADGETRHYRVLVTNDGGTTTYNFDGLSATATNELWLVIPDRIAPAYTPTLSLGTCATGIQASATDDTPLPDREYIGIEIQRRETGSSTWSVALRETVQGRMDPVTVSVCDPLPADGRSHDYRARTYDAAGNYSPSSTVHTATVSRG
jgi:hypothetical protein